jgi:hypothetical protein
VFKFFNSLILWPLVLSRTLIASGDSVKTYVVEGMECGGCALSVERALKRAGISKQQIVAIDYGKPSPNGLIGHLSLRFDRDLGKETDCKVIKAIEKYSGYLTYRNASEKYPCGRP